MSSFQQIIKLSLPLIGAQLAQSSLMFTDAILMGMLGISELAGGGLGVAVFHFIFIVATGILAATINLVAFAKGQDNQDEIHQTLLAGIFLAVILTLITGTIIWNIAPLLSILGQSAENTQLATIYLQAVVWSLLPSFALTVLRNFSLGMSNAGSILKISLIGAVLNLPVSYVLMNGLLEPWTGIPALGLAGIGYGTSIVLCCMFTAFAIDLYRKPEYKRFYFWHGWNRFDINQLTCTLKLGIPISVAYAMESGLFAAAAIFAGWLGSLELATHQIALQTIVLAFMLPTGISQATSVFVGNHFAKNDIEQVKRYAKSGLILGAMFTATSAAIMVLFPEFIINLFISADHAEHKPLVVEMGIKLLVVAAIFQLVDGTQVIAMGILRGLKMSTAPTLITAVGYWLIGFPSAYVLMETYGLVGVWSGLGIGLAATAAMLMVLFRNKLQKEQRTVETVPCSIMQNQINQEA
ncbi:MATE family efflux transporter [Litoribacillus peritrichatus]|uniref:Multidrug-efflux transporter n=1 Tax=Litoribacillus peritrichatus TaxID=718191 RepID=A0ABP7MYN2_9GAMM